MDTLHKKFSFMSEAETITQRNENTKEPSDYKRINKKNPQNPRQHQQENQLIFVSICIRDTNATTSAVTEHYFKSTSTPLLTQ